MTSSVDAAGDVEVVAAIRAELGEGPVWDARTERLVWVDIVGRSILMTDPETGATDSFDVPLDVGSLVPRAEGGFVAALQDGFWIVGDGAPRRFREVAHGRRGLRFNDGKCDPDGRFWAGTMAYAKTPGAGSLYRLDGAGAATEVLDGVTISNGLAWSHDGSTMFYVDTPTQRIDAFAFSRGTVTDRRTVVEIPAEQGAPDGITIDADGGLWVALWGGAAVHRYVDGRLDRVVELPVTQPTSCTFGGRDLAELFVTSAWSELTGEERRAQPLAGALFRVRPGVHGVLPVMYRST